ncbi:APC family permease [uncultured Pseudokineococcus sp.]|uniref:APC family permease n=1 Tax=uncultured Pseudokineococcus sp. TaxID=1642928 RepID=UPI00262B600D|nr:APC family permease [uncultured Pseudokineococcus sp.]
MTSADGASRLRRQLGTGDAVVVGVSSMLGAGVFAALAPAAAAAGAGLLVGLAVAAVVAACNATSSAQLAVQHPSSGGTYLFGRRQLGPWWGYVAGWGFVVGKTASCAAMALTAAAYAVPGPWQRPAAAVLVVALAALGYRGVTRTARAARVLLAVVLLALALVVVSAAAGRGGASGAASPLDGLLAPGDGGWRGVLQAAGILFFAFAGYARVTTLAEEVRAPERTIPRAVLLALAAVLVVYGVVAVAALGALGPAALASAAAPLEQVVGAGPWPGAGALVRAGAVAACCGALLALLAGISRTALAMAREGDLPRWLAAVHPRHGVPHHAEVAVAAVVAVAVLLGDLREVIGFSSFGVLVYYLVANLSALTQTREHRIAPRAVAVLGAVGCAVLALSLPTSSVVTGSGVLVAGVALRLVLRRRAGRSA